ncbi:alkaline phosphatase [Parabacteroides sp. CAG:409]|nr:alkaline phosphatase [Parabacteroides sp. CAG:409]
MKKMVLFLFLCLSLEAMSEGPKNVIIMIGDGMGINQIQAAYTQNGGMLNMTDRCPYVGLRRTNSVNNYTTDSAAGGTAIATGKKTNNGMVGMSPDSVPLHSILRLATLNGLLTGVISTSSLTDATPASFVAHQPLRYMQEEIAADYLNSGINLFIGGGKKYFEQRKDGRNISEEMEKKGYEVVYSLYEAKNVSGNLGVLLSEDGMDPFNKRENDFLANATELAIEQLSKDKKGFVLMVEGSQIDWGGHNNDQAWMIGEVLDFDKAVGKVLDFAEKDGNTLVIVTADHETGGVAIQGGNYDKKEVTVKYTTGGHSSSPVPLFAYGPGAELFSGFKDNTSSFYLIKELIGLRCE